MNARKFWLLVCYVLAVILTIFELGWLARVYKAGIPVSQLHLELVMLVMLAVPIIVLLFMAALWLIAQSQSSGGSDCGSRRFWRKLNYTVLGYWTVANLLATPILSLYRFTTSPSQLCAHYAKFDPTCRITTIVGFVGFPAAFFAALALWIMRRNRREEKEREERVRHTDVERAQRLQIVSQPCERQAMDWRTVNPDFSRKPDDLTWSQADYTMSSYVPEAKGVKEEDMHVVPLTPR